VLEGVRIASTAQRRVGKLDALAWEPASGAERKHVTVPKDFRSPPENVLRATAI